MAKAAISFQSRDGAGGGVAASFDAFSGNVSGRLPEVGLGLVMISPVARYRHPPNRRSFALAARRSAANFARP